MSVITFSDFLGMLPLGSDLVARRQPTGVTLPKGPNPRFVEPDLIVEQPIEVGQTAVALLAAPGAVGKSTVASEIAARRSSPFWDLSKFQVGTGTFSGTILDMYDFAATGAIKRFREGKALFVLDALDEAQVRAGSQNFDAFLAELAGACREPREKPSLVLLARTDTADWVNLILEEAGVPLGRCTISYFDEARANEFIDKLLDARCAADDRQPFHRQQRAPFSDARRELFGLIYKLFSVEPQWAWQDPRVRSFLGYAPVLEALAGYLDVGNYLPLIQELRASAGIPNDPWRFLTEIVDRILERESRKLSEAVRPQLAPTAARIAWSGWDTLYSNDEQCARVLCHSMRIPPSSALRTQLPPTLSVPYDEALKIQLPQHPFLAGTVFANVVFKEYCYAWGLLRGAPTLTNALRDAMRHREQPFLPSHVFGWFVVNLCASGSSLLDGQDFGLFYESLSSTSGQGWLTVSQGEELLRAEFALPVEDGDEIVIQLVDTGAGLRLWRGIRNAELDVACAVRLGLPEQRFALGPEVDIRCSGLIVLADSLDVDVTGGVAIHADSYSSQLPDLKLRLRNQGSGELAVNWPNVAHPWAPFLTEPAPAARRLIDSVKGDALRKFILMFYRQRRRKLSTVKASRWAPSQLADRDRLVELALQRGVIRRVPGDRHETVELTPEFYSLDTLVRGGGEPSSKVRTFLAEYLGSEEAERILS